MDERALVALTRRQHGLITRAQALAAGGSDGAIGRRIARGAWSRMRAGVYAIGAPPSTWEQRAMAAVLAAGPDAWASHRTAARLWGLVERSGPIELVVPDERRVRLEGVVAHRSRHLTRADRSSRDGIACTTLPRTIVDASASAGERLVGRWVDLGIRDHGLSITSVAGRASELAGPGRRIPPSLVAALALRSDGHDPGRSALEARVIEALARAGLPAPERQWRFERADGRHGFLDLAYPGALLAIELDGWAEHGLRSAFDADRVRGNEVVLAGWRLLRFTWAMSDAQIVAAVVAALG
ncbi:MAG: hypothetical protein R2702_15720 [Acidimicrobiales bacterium]